MKEILDFISSFSSGDFSKRLKSSNNNANLERVIANLNLAAEALETKTQLEEKNMLIESILENIPVGIFLKDAKDNFRITVWNKAAEDVFEVPKNIVLGKTTHDLWPKKDADSYLAADRNVMDNNLQLDIPIESVQTKSRGTVLLHTKKIPLHVGVEQRKSFLLGICEDITEQKKIELDRNIANERLEAAASAGLIGVWDWDIERDKLFWDKVMYRLYGIKEEDFGGAFQAWTNALHPEDKLYAEGEIQAALAGKREYCPQFKIIWPDGSIRHIKAFSKTFFNKEGTPIRMLGVNYDVTEQKLVEFEILNAKSEAELANKTQAAFLANMSHEIRTPLNGIIGMIQVLLTETHSPSTVMRLKIIENCGKSLVSLVSDILDISKIEAGKMELEMTPFDLKNTIKEIMVLHSSIATQKGLSIKLKIDAGVPRWILSDVNRFTQILNNLISNAIKFTSSGSVGIFIQNTNVNDKHEMCLQVSVEDTGDGIPDLVKEKLFTSFTQADISTTRKYGGTGLGLAICKSLCEKMGGTIWIDNQREKGTVFHFTFMTKESAPIEQNEITKDIDFEMAKKFPLEILLAEDNRLNQIVATDFLAKLGYEVDLAANGVEVLENLKFKNYDVIFMDCHMPVMDGFETTQRIYALEDRISRPKIIAMTAGVTKEDKLRCFEAGMEYFIEKPVQMNILANVLRTCANRNTFTPIYEDLSTSAEHNVEKKCDSPMDTVRFMQNFRGLEDLISNTLSAFLTDCPEMLSQVKVAIDNKNPEALELAAHSLKGAVSNLFAAPSVALAYKLECMGKNKNLDSAQNEYTYLDEELERLKLVLEQLIEGSKVA